jgi:hypothetical protein
MTLSRSLIYIITGATLLLGGAYITFAYNQPGAGENERTALGLPADWRQSGTGTAPQLHTQQIGEVR